MHFDIFDPNFWGNSVWQGISVVVTIVTWLLGPFVTAFLERLVSKPDAQQKHINAYKALALREGSMSFREIISFLPIQSIAAYGLSLLIQRIFFVNQFEPINCFELSLLAVLVVTWGLSLAKRKILASLLTWQFCVSLVALCLILVGHKAAIPITKDFTFLKHFVGQYLSPDVKQAPVISSLRTLPLNAIPVDLTIAHPEAAKTLFGFLYAGTMIPFVSFYSLYKRHLALQVTAFAQLSEKEKQEKLDELHYQERTEALAIKQLEKTEKEEELKYKREQTTLLKERDTLAVEKERIAVASVKLDLEKKRAEYTLQLTALIVDTLYTGVDTVEMRVELIRNMLPALKDIGQKESTTIILEHLQHINRETPVAIPAVTEAIIAEERV